MKRVLIITYYWPPAGGSAVYRWLKFTKYLRDFGWEPVIYTAENGEYAELDPENAKDIPLGVEIIKRPIWEPYQLYKRFIGQKKADKVNVGFLTEHRKPALAEKISVWIRGNFFIPDARRFWVKPSVRFLVHYLKERPVDAVVSTGPPHSMHLIARELKMKCKIPWIADFRDPWTEIDFYEDLFLTRMADKKHRSLEKDVVTTSDCIIAIGSQMSESFLKLGAKRAVTITNGFDTADIITENVLPDKKFSIAHFGTVNKARNPELLWKVIAELVKEEPEFARDVELKFVGRLDQSASESIGNYGLSSFINKIDFLPHKEVLRMQKQAQVLLLLINRSQNATGILTGKFFEYLAAARPIIGIGATSGDVTDILTKAQAGTMVEFSDQDALKKVIYNYYRLYRKGTLVVNPEGIQQYSRFELTRKLAEVLESVVGA